jgi:hypothetical protein
MQTVRLRYDEAVDIVLPDGQKVQVLLSYCEPGEQQPEIDIMLPESLAINCFESHLCPAENPGLERHVLLARQIIIPIPIKT